MGGISIYASSLMMKVENMLCAALQTYVNVWTVCMPVSLNASFYQAWMPMYRRVMQHTPQCTFA